MLDRHGAVLSATDIKSWHSGGDDGGGLGDVGGGLGGEGGEGGPGGDGGGEGGEGALGGPPGEGGPQASQGRQFSTQASMYGWSKHFLTLSSEVPTACWQKSGSSGMFLFSSHGTVGGGGGDGNGGGGGEGGHVIVSSKLPVAPP